LALECYPNTGEDHDIGKKLAGPREAMRAAFENRCNFQAIEPQDSSPSSGILGQG